MTVSRLDWDSDFFELEVFRIDDPDLAPDALPGALDALDAAGATLVYWPATRRVALPDHPTFAGHLADEKVTYACDLAEAPEMPDRVVPYAPPLPYADLERLALQAGEYSRFALDPNLPREKFEDLYRTWIEKSVDRRLALEVLVVPAEGRVAGFVTLGDKGGRGDIGLVAVDAGHRGQGHGRALVHAAQAWFRAHGFREGQVVTQGVNAAACRLYEACGYAVDRTEYVHHFWRISSSCSRSSP